MLYRATRFAIGTLGTAALLLLVTQLSWSGENLSIPVPAKTPPGAELISPEVKKPLVTKLKGWQNPPPFELAKAKTCEAELKRRNIKFTILDKITDSKGCLVERPLELRGLSNGIALSNDITARCEMVLALDKLISQIVTPSAELHLGKKLVQVATSTSYQCRTRNSIVGTKISEHGFANAIDIIGFKLDDGTVIPVSPKHDIVYKNDLSVAKFQSAIRAGACAYFTTVLGPGSNAAHEEHFHFDLAYRKGGYRICE